jgi:hypothetical protein
MDASELVQSISAETFNLDYFVQLAIKDQAARDEMVRQLTTHPHIMVYYHCFYVVSKASAAHPGLFYPYWGSIAPLLQHKNSYHRDIALTILANLTPVDSRNLFNPLFENYFEHLNDLKFMTAQCCVRNSAKIFNHKPELRAALINRLLAVEQYCTYPEKQKALIKADVLDVFEQAYPFITDRQAVDDFIRAAADSVSPKTRVRARALAARLGLAD